MVVFAHGFILFLLGRVIQGFGAAGPRIVIVAILRDKFKGAQMAKVLSLVMGIFILASIFAPSVGLNFAGSTVANNFLGGAGLS